MILPILLPESIALSSAGPTKDASDNLPIERRGSFFWAYKLQLFKQIPVDSGVLGADASDRFVGANRCKDVHSVNVS